MKNKRILIIACSIAAVLVIVLSVFLINLNKSTETYEVSFIIDDDSNSVIETINEGEKVTKPTDPEKEGYVFIGWTYQNETYDFSQEVTSDLELKAKWEEIKEEVKTFTVKFDSDEGTTIPNQVIEEGKQIEIPNEPTKEGYVFKGWTLNGEVYNLEEAVTADLELKAIWEKINNNNNDTNASNNNTTNNTNSNNNNNNNNQNNNQEENDNTAQPETPTLSNASGGMNKGVKSAQLTIGAEGAYATMESIKAISGYELYEKNGSKYTKIGASETKFSTDVTVDAGEIKIYVARVYVYNKSKVKVYSNYSNEIKIDNAQPETPTLSNASGGMNKGIKSAQLTIGAEGAYGYGTENISGYELYEKNGSQYTKIGTSETKFNTDVTVDVGESKTYVARVYVYNKSKVKVYSNYSNEIKIDNAQPETPTLSNVAGGPGFAQLSVLYEGAYGYGTENISGFEIYEKNGSQCTLVHTSETMFNTDVTVDVGESKTYVARVYAYNKSNVKVYSNYSNEINISNEVLTPTLSTPAGGPGFVQLSVVYEGAYGYGTEKISGFELYEKNGTGYTLIHTSETTFNTDVTVDAGESKTYAARVYAYNKLGVKIYSNYSNEIVI